MGNRQKEPVLCYFFTKQGLGMKARTLGGFKLCSALFSCHMLQEEILEFGVLVVFFFLFPTTEQSLKSSLSSPASSHQHSYASCHIHSCTSKGKPDMFCISQVLFLVFFFFFNHRLALEISGTWASCDFLAPPEQIWRARSKFRMNIWVNFWTQAPVGC